MEETPKFKLKEEVKDIVSSTKKLKRRIMSSFDTTQNTIWRWLKIDAAQSTDYNLLLLVWLWITETDERRERYSHFKNLENLLTQK